jgi:plastocyanin
VNTRLVSLAAAYLVAAGLVAPAALRAADQAPDQTTTGPADQPPQKPPAAAPQPAQAQPRAQPEPRQQPQPAPAPATPPGPTAEDGSARLSVARAAASGSVTIKDFAYQPASITVHTGDSVTWTNRDTAPHSATGKGGSFDTGVFGKGKSGSHTFDKAGTFAYICSVHPNMHGTVKVVSASSGGGGQSASSSSGSSSSGSSSGSKGSSPGSSGTASSSGSSLPKSGLDAAGLAFLGLGLLGLGLHLRRQAERERL